MSLYEVATVASICLERTLDVDGSPWGEFSKVGSPSERKFGLHCDRSRLKLCQVKVVSGSRYTVPGSVK
jgi:hypothetical protein